MNNIPQENTNLSLCETKAILDETIFVPQPTFWLIQGTALFLRKKEA